MNLLDNSLTLLESLLLPALLAVFGGIARSCRFGVSSLRQFFGGVVVSGFAGVVTHLLLQETALSDSVQAAIVATSGYSGGAILDAVQSRIIKAVDRLPGPESPVEPSGRPGGPYPEAYPSRPAAQLPDPAGDDGNRRLP